MRRALAETRKRGRDGDDPAALQAELDQLAEAVGRGELPVREYLRVRQPLDARRRRALEVAETNGAVAPVLDTSDLRGAWAQLDQEGRRAVLSVLIERVTISPAKSPRTKFDPERIGITWRA